FALVDEGVDEMAEIGRELLGGEVLVVAQPRERGDRVHGGVEDELRPLRRPQVGQRLGLQAGAEDEVGGLLDGLEGRVLVRAEAVSVAWRSLRPVTVRPSRSSASAWS